MDIYFEKYEACGNDFLFIPSLYMNKDFVCKICDRHYGIGADGVIASDTLSFKYMNNDGSEATFCGNGLRCFIAHNYNRHLIGENGKVDVNETLLTYSIIRNTPFLIEVAVNTPIIMESGTINYQDICYEYTLVNGLNAHCVIEMETEPSLDLIISISNILNKIFPNGINVNFIYRSSTGLHVITYERGCGLTLACSSGAIASYYYLLMNHKANECEQIYFLSGQSILLTFSDNHLKMLGEANYIMKGLYRYE